MDVRLQANPQLRHAVNRGTGRNPRLGEDNALLCLSQEEQECIQFFEDTIGSLEKSLQDDEHKAGQAKPVVSGRQEVDGPVTSSPLMARSLSPKDQDIIDLVHPEPAFNHASPDFQSMGPTPESHFDIKPRRDSTDNLPSEYNPPLPSGSYGPTDQSSYQPTGCIPTPVLIAQKIAENKASGSSSLLPSVVLHRRSIESENPPDHPVKQGPPTSAKPSRFPANINMIHGNKEHQNQSLANVNIYERRAQMLANLTGTSHALLQEEPQQALEQKPRNTPSRSISFKDPNPDISRMEALSKLGLNRNRAMSGGTSGLPDTFQNPRTGAETTAKSAETKKAEILQTSSLKSQEQRNSQRSPAPPAVTQSSKHPPPLENKAANPPPPEVTSLAFNSYGGKSIVVNPSVFSRGEAEAPQTSPEPKPLPPALANPSEFNSYGGKSKVMTPGQVAVTRNDLPDILSSHVGTSQMLPAKTELNSYGGKSRTINPSAGLNRSPESHTKSVRAPAPAPAPRPPRHSYHGAVAPLKTAQQALSPDHRRKSASMFRPQGITVQFSGRGATNESRREALKKLGLLKDS
ncbi:proline and serine-rich protein 2 [Echeneis naucrates]|uniref:proline and serine-rich protein 2 n=1 Tax=Echeneis naucrates TaxID=173247 RepID=UPI0011141F50|nr:proline and serine-rich protein 2 [Echeneis naucrates]